MAAWRSARREPSPPLRVSSAPAISHASSADRAWYERSASPGKVMCGDRGLQLIRTGGGMEGLLDDVAEQAVEDLEPAADSIQWSRAFGDQVRREIARPPLGDPARLLLFDGHMDATNKHADSRPRP
jgi:hypothetical protein